MCLDEAMGFWCHMGVQGLLAFCPVSALSPALGLSWNGTADYRLGKVPSPDSPSEGL